MKKDTKTTYMQIVSWILLFFYYLYALYPVLKSGYMYDDLINYTVNGWCINNDSSIWQLTKDIFLNWYHANGRCFIFASYTYLLFSVVNQFVYKFLIVLMTFVNGVLLSKCLYKVTKSEKLMWLSMLFFPALISLDCSWFNAMFGFQMLLHICFLWVLLGVLFFIKYTETSRKSFQILSCVFWFIALGTYEISYPFCILFFIVSLYAFKKFWPSVRKLIPQAVIGVFWLIINIVARKNATSKYVGTSVSLGPECFTGFAKQISGSSSIANFITLRELNKIQDITSILSERWLYYVILFVFITTGAILIDRFATSSKKFSPHAILMALSIMVFPAILMAISERYQSEITWRHGYLPAYISCWGITVCIAIFLTKLSNLKSIFAKSIKYLLIFLISIIGVINSMVGDITVSNANKGMPAINDFVADACDTGLLDELTTDLYLIDGNNCWAEVDSHYAYLLNRKVQGVGWETLYIKNKDGSITHSDLFTEIAHNGYYYSYFVTGQFNVFGHCNDIIIEENPNDTIRKSMYTSDFTIYIPNTFAANTVGFIDRIGATQAIPLQNCEIVNTSDTGTVYKYHHTESLDLNTISVY